MKKVLVIITTLFSVSVLANCSEELANGKQELKAGIIAENHARDYWNIYADNQSADICGTLTSLIKESSIAFDNYFRSEVAYIKAIQMCDLEGLSSTSAIKNLSATKNRIDANNAILEIAAEEYALKKCEPK